MTSIRDFPTTFSELTRFLNGRSARTLCNNTVVERRLAEKSDKGTRWLGEWLDDEYILWITLHGHHIATLWKDGTIYVRSAGWETMTTKQRLNKILRPLGVSIYSDRYRWRIRDYKTGRRFEFFGDLIVPFPWGDTPYGPSSVEVWT